MKKTIFEQLTSRETALALVGLGYVGMPIAVAFANKGLKAIGFDLNKAKIELYKSGVDPTVVAHNEFRALKLSDLKALYRQTAPEAEKVLIDVKELYPIEKLKASGLTWWRL